MRIHFMVNGLGLGHLYRSLPLIDELKKKGHEISISSFGKSYEILLKEGYKVEELPAIGELITKKDEIEVGKSLIENMKRISPRALKRITDAIMKNKPDVLVVDGYIPGVFISKMLRVPVVSIINCTKLSYVFKQINGLIEFGSDVVSKNIVDLSSELIIPDYEPPFTITARNLEFFGSEHKFNFVGPLDIIKPKKKSKDVLITMGGSGLQKSDIKIIKNSLEKMGYNVISEGLVEKKKINDMIAKAPFIVTHGGHTSIMSCTTSKTGLILIPLKDYTERVNNCLGVMDKRIGVSLETDFLDEKTIKLSVETVCSKQYKENLEIYSKIDTSNNIKKACSIIEKVGLKNRNK
jgi:UDP:flavonoid glycosyltransferase YjiC (YdhE family)